MASPRCPSCTDKGIKICGSCRAIKYCSEECQQADWRFHKTFCKLYRNLPPRPSFYHRLIVVFPEKGARPELKWTEDLPYSEGDYFPKDAHVGLIHIWCNEITNADMGRMVTLYCEESFLSRYPQPNKAIKTATADQATFRWSGPIVAACTSTSWYRDCGIHGAYDMDMLACSNLAAYLVWYRNETEAGTARRERGSGGKVDAVKVNCPGEQALNGVATYVPVKVPIMHPIFEDGAAKIADISVGIGMPLLTWKYAQNAAWPEFQDRRFNPVSHMHKGINPKEDVLGYAPWDWDTGIGNALVMRQDRQPLTVEEVEAFADFCFLHLDEYFQYFGEAGREGDEERQGKLDAMIVAEASEAKWKTYFEDWRKVKAGVTDDPEVNGRVGGRVRMGVTGDDSEKLGRYLSKSGFV